MNKNFAKMTIEEIEETLLSIKESKNIELKTASKLPKSFWETYSSFCNTNGGYIILGVEENKNSNKIVGIENPDKLIKDLWNNLSNKSKTNYYNINYIDVVKYKISGKTIIIVSISEVPESAKPVYVNGKKENTYIRTGEGDRKVTDEQFNAFVRNAKPQTDDSVIRNYTLEDLDMESVALFKNKVSERYKDFDYSKLNEEEFLIKIGACRKSRINGKLQILQGALLFLGKYNSIKEKFPQYHLDYYNKCGEGRWIDRVADDDPSPTEMNLFNFFNIVFEKIKLLIKESFQLDENLTRKSSNDFIETIRECLVNCLAHADYNQGYPSIKIEVYDGWFRFINPGKMLVNEDQFFVGGNSVIRNEIIMKMFRLLGFSERQGFGGPQIYDTAIKNRYRRPEIITDLEFTEIIVWNVGIAKAYPDLSEEERTVYEFLSEMNIGQSVNHIANKLNMTDYKTRQCLKKLEEKNLIIKLGNGPSTKYELIMDKTEMLTKLQMLLETLKRL